MDQQQKPPQPAIVTATKIFDKLTETVNGGDKDKIAKVWGSIRETETMDILVHAYLDEREKMDLHLAVLKTLPFQTQHARRLESSVRALAEERRKVVNLRLVSTEEASKQRRPLSDTMQGSLPPAVLVDNATLGQLIVPPGYMVDPTGVYRQSIDASGLIHKTPIATAPIFMTSRTFDINTGEAKRQLVWRGPSGWCTRIVERRTCFDARYLISLAAFDAPVNSGNLGAMITYLSEFERENASRLPASTSTSRMGWQKDGSFVLPDQHYTTSTDSPPLVLTPPPGYDRIQSGWVTEGSWKAWCDLVTEVGDHPYPFIAIYAAAAAPLMNVLKLPGFVVDFSGETSGGKTTMLRLAASVWGRPSDAQPSAMYSWDSTKVWIERTAGFLQNLPLILDETKRAKSHRIVRDVIYDFCQGQGRGRGALDGSRKTDSWCSVMLSSGEGAATDFSQDAGTRARVLALKGRPLGRDPKEGGRLSEEIQMVVAENYGHLGRKMIQYLIAMTDQHEDLRGMYREARDYFSKAVDNPVARRHSAYLAVLHVTSRILHTQLEVPEPRCDVLEPLLEAQAYMASDADRPLEVLRDVLTWVTANQTSFYGRHVCRQGEDLVPHNGWKGRWDDTEEWTHIYIVNNALSVILKQLGHHPPEIIQSWVSRDYLDAGNKTATKTTRIAGAVARCYAIKREVVDACMYMD